MPRIHFRFTMIAGAISALFAPLLHAASAGKIDFATPGVNAISPNGQSRPVAKGSELQTGETIDTGAGRAQLRFSDGGMVSLQPQTQFRLETYGYDKDDSNKNSVVMNLLKGGLRTITGLIGKTNRQGYKLQTATATVGIRGTEFSITTLPDGSVLFNCADGAIDVTNRSGSTTINGGQSAIVNTQTSTPTKTEDKPFLPPLVSLAQTQIPLPPNPVQDSQAAQAASALVGTFSGQFATASWSSPDSNSPMTPGYGSNPAFTLAPSGHLAAYSYGSHAISLGAGQAQSFGNDGIMAWGRWVGTVNDNRVEGGTYTYDAQNPLHYVVGQPVTNMPTSGTATYSQYGGTGTSCTGACGTITVGSSLSVNFGTMTGSFNMSVANSAGNVNLSGSSGLSFSNNNTNFNGFAQMTGTGTINSGYGSLAGFFAGPGASHAGAAFNINYTQGTGYGGTATSIAGAAVYKK
ncbi:MAG: hypothetical protein JWN73_1146 [Betaproteobacteria bacterium]|nr:hypothetical protein [Betaproteobacteria bacterium]